MYGFMDSAQLKQVFPCFASLFKAMQGIKTALWHFHREIQIVVKKETNKSFKRLPYTLMSINTHSLSFPICHWS